MQTHIASSLSARIMCLFLSCYILYKQQDARILAAWPLRHNKTVQFDELKVEGLEFQRQ